MHVVFVRQKGQVVKKQTGFIVTIKNRYTNG